LSIQYQPLWQIFRSQVGFVDVLKICTKLQYFLNLGRN